MCSSKCSTFVIFLGYVLNTFGILFGHFLGYFWDTSGMLLGYFLNTFGILFSTLGFYGDLGLERARNGWNCWNWLDMAEHG